MGSLAKTYDVFITHSPADANLAAKIADDCRAGGLEAVTHDELDVGENLDDALWEALAESRGMLALIPATGPTPMMNFEFGAARAWNKPIFGVLPDASRSRPNVRGIEFFPSNRIGDAIRAIKQLGDDFSDGDRSRLADVYTAIGVSADKLALDPIHLEELVKGYRAGKGKAVSGERLLSELLRMRKQGKLPRIHAKVRKSG